MDDIAKGFLIRILKLAEIMAELGAPGADDQVQELRQLLAQGENDDGKD
jgi:hypothetical protein